MRKKKPDVEITGYLPLDIVVSALLGGALSGIVVTAVQCLARRAHNRGHERTAAREASALDDEWREFCEKRGGESK